MRNNIGHLPCCANPNSNISLFKMSLFNLAQSLKFFDCYSKISKNFLLLYQTKKVKPAQGVMFSLIFLKQKITPLTGPKQTGFFTFIFHFKFFLAITLLSKKKLFANLKNIHFEVPCFLKIKTLPSVRRARPNLLIFGN